MKRIVLTFIAHLMLCGFAFSALAQPHFGPRPPRPEDMTDEEFIKIQCRDMANALELEGRQRESFLKVYGEFRAQIDTLAKQAFRPFPDKKPSEDEIEKAILGNFEISRKILQIRIDFYSRFKEILVPSQIQKMYFIENDRGRRVMLPEDRRTPQYPDR